MDPWGQLSVLINAGEFLILIWLLIHLRHASGPALAALVDSVRKEQDIMRGNLSGLSESSIADRHRMVDADARIWEELRRIHARLDEMRCPIGHAECPLNGGKR